MNNNNNQVNRWKQIEFSFFILLIMVSSEFLFLLPYIYSLYTFKALLNDIKSYTEYI